MGDDEKDCMATEVRARVRVKVRALARGLYRKCWHILESKLCQK